MKVIQTISYVFTLLGLFLLAAAFYAYNSTSEFSDNAQSTQGEVIGLFAVHDDDDGDVTYRPIVRFRNGDGTVFEFTSSSGSNPSLYQVGEAVTVLYEVGQEEQAEIDAFLSLWLVTIILGFVGLIFASTGIGMRTVIRAKAKKKAYLKAKGVPITATIQDVFKNTNVKVNGQSPFKIAAQWQKPGTSDIYIFKSDNIWFDPTSYLESDQITVLIEKDNPKIYDIPLDFLPKVKT